MNDYDARREDGYSELIHHHLVRDNAMEFAFCHINRTLRLHQAASRTDTVVGWCAQRLANMYGWWYSRELKKAQKVMYAYLPLAKMRSDKFIATAQGRP